MDMTLAVQIVDQRVSGSSGWLSSSSWDGAPRPARHPGSATGRSSGRSSSRCAAPRRRGRPRPAWRLRSPSSLGKNGGTRSKPSRRSSAPGAAPARCGSAGRIPAVRRDSVRLKV